MKVSSNLPDLMLVCAATRLDVLQSRLAASPCLQRDAMPWATYWNVQSAASAFNAVAATRPGPSWLIWAHQDVYLPQGWDACFVSQLGVAQERWPNLAVVGVYGLQGHGPGARRAGHVLDRGQMLAEAVLLPCLADSLDELLFAVRVDSGLRLDSKLGFDFYATDLVLQAQAAGYSCAVLDAYCEHWSDTPTKGPLPTSMIERISSSARVFEEKWCQRLPVSTPCFEIRSPGDVQVFLESLA